MKNKLLQVRYEKPFYNGTKKKILFASVPADGHFNPLTGLAAHLQNNGYEVAWYAADLYKDKLSEMGIRHFPFNKAQEITALNIEDVYPQRKNITSQVGKLNFDIIHFFIERSEEYYADIVEIKKIFHFDIMIADVAFTAIPFVKTLLKTPVISVGVFPLTEKSVDLPPAGLGIIPSYSIAGKMKQSLLRLIADKILFRKANKVMKKVLGRNGLPHYNTNMFDLLVKSSSILVQSGTPGFEYYRSDLGTNIRFIGSLLPLQTGTSEQWFDKRVYQFKKIVLVTQGTVEKDINKLLIPALEAFRNTDVLVIATTGDSHTQELKSRYPQNNFIIEDYIPFSDVMPYADVYISNGGYGGVMLAIENGLPMVAAGIHEGKNEINARIGYFELGINLKTEYPEPAQIKAAVNDILSDRFYADNVATLSNEFAEYDPYALILKYTRQLIDENSRDMNEFSRN